MVVTQPPGPATSLVSKRFGWAGTAFATAQPHSSHSFRSLVALFPMSIASKVCVLLVLLGLMASLAGGGASASPAASTMPSLGHKVRAAPRWTGAQYGRLTGQLLASIHAGKQASLAVKAATKLTKESQKALLKAPGRRGETLTVTIKAKYGGYTPMEVVKVCDAIKAGDIKRTELKRTEYSPPYKYPRLVPKSTVEMYLVKDPKTQQPKYEALRGRLTMPPKEQPLLTEKVDTFLQLATFWAHRARLPFRKKAIMDRPEKLGTGRAPDATRSGLKIRDDPAMAAAAAAAAAVSPIGDDGDALLQQAAAIVGASRKSRVPTDTQSGRAGTRVSYNKGGLHMTAQDHVNDLVRVEADREAQAKKSTDGHLAYVYKWRKKLNDTTAKLAANNEDFKKLSNPELIAFILAREGKQPTNKQKASMVTLAMTVKNKPVTLGKCAICIAKLADYTSMLEDGIAV